MYALAEFQSGMPITFRVRAQKISDNRKINCTARHDIRRENKRHIYKATSDVHNNKLLDKQSQISRSLMVCTKLVC